MRIKLSRVVAGVVAVALAAPGVAQAGVSTAGYVNPLATDKALVPERIDMGVDFNANAGSPIRALGDFKVYAVAASGSGWTSPENTQAFVGYTLLDGAYARKQIYVSEDIIPKVSVGHTGKAGDVIATFKSSPTGLEIGWGSGNSFESLAGALGQYGVLTAAGASFDTLLVSLGASKAPNWGGQVHGTMPSGYPSIWSIPSDALPLKIGSSGMNVREVERALIARGHPIAADGVYGSPTASAVKIWQRNHNRAVTGEIASDDWLFMFPTLRIGGPQWPEATLALQHGLRRCGYHVALNGVYGSGMAHAVTLFQQRRGLTADGIVNQLTWRKLFKK